MIVFRLSKARVSNDLSGKGAEIAGGRWNSIGTAILYCAANRALCTAEIAVHTPLGIVPKNYFLISVEIPQSAKIKELEIDKLPEHWNAFPHIPQIKKIGDQFVRKKEHLILKVPSAVIQGEFNFLLNPSHKEFKMVKIRAIEPFGFDKRLFVK